MSFPGIQRSTLQAIGGTPLVRLDHVVPEGAAQVLLKLEGGNPTGSYKDRMALALIEGAERRGVLRPGQRVVEYTGGSTGSSLAFVCAVKGYPLTLVTSDAFAPEKTRTMRAFGAEVIVVPGEGGQVTPDLFARMRQEAHGIVEREGAFWADQFHNTDAHAGYTGLGREILRQTESGGASVDVFCAAVGTAGMISGVSAVLRQAGSRARIVALEPSSSPVLTVGTAGPHRVEGIATGIVPPLLTADVLDEARTVDEAEARRMALRLAREEGILAGTSSALNVVGAIGLARELGAGHTVVTVAPDTGLKYLTGDLFEG
ncbi:PLP-dependent cysteine synthase family protein [Streptomyces diastatochromogenes]|uniref:Cysteine synthase n=1 Tax=Streptomyces diastatochromogenes TaxID=42236 RepID=A0A233RQZ2_STRDA|nr:cysteine synthase family protein [Streptomyces diastatochromogenes]MCZ0984843.1 cysteine synthase family protein [Streptomyces diastatochromogenes]OXY85816.1 cysteine synthase [Streptomyces diastatochromogenes]